jgi:hypothetical protein
MFPEWNKSAPVSLVDQSVATLTTGQWQISYLWRKIVHVLPGCLGLDKGIRGYERLAKEVRRIRVPVIAQADGFDHILVSFCDCVSYWISQQDWSKHLRRIFFS